MPPQVLPTQVGIREVFDVLIPRHFSTAEGLEQFHASTRNLRAIPPHPRVGRELAFVYPEKHMDDQSDDLAAVLWTTWLLSTHRARSEDCGWLIIEEAGVKKYVVPIHRTKNFIAHAILEAQIARLRIRTRPRCPTCATRMSITFGQAMGSRYWRCPFHRDRKDWDHEAFLKELEKHPEAARYLARRRKQRGRWQDQCRKAGKPIRQAVLLRKKWRKIRIRVAEL
jgi:hypothetical protein